MIQFILRRMVQVIPVLLGISIITFGLLQLTGDPTAVMLPLDATDEARALLRADLGLDQPLPVQFAKWLGSALQGDLGNSLRYRQPALGLFMSRFDKTVRLSGLALLFGVTAGVLLGTLAAVNRNRPVDGVAMMVALVGQSVPGFYLAIVLIAVFAVGLRAFPSHGSATAVHYVLPIVALALYPMAMLARFTRSCLLEVMSKDYIKTARAKGLVEQVVIFKHAMRNSMIPIITVIALQLGGLFGMAVAVETVFAWPGTGRLILEAVFTRDFPVVQVGVLVTAVMFVMANLAGDILYSVTDPRVRFE